MHKVVTTLKEMDWLIYSIAIVAAIIAIVLLAV